ncbi:thermostable beta-glucosidase B, putative [Entamoeba invadens IP1]|uniref:beta-glucosidase n=1 Tax=Entamoeba invadens IP1 TaxID=370355 RepID=A0A0A1U233_ENTIV|nr:thermostable beta-glucosidase B, putative [Entamoeba invadens IP1]ELP86713.1 thermostable beta-glucosidase B, putative [Entamoeba invadens IP1]|eukprot:XP_004186059.1 thermostable beta-glucosidase B, putative [Entamoeba invadens IP1]
MEPLPFSKKQRQVFGHYISIERDSPFPPTPEEFSTLVPGAAGIIFPTEHNKSVVLADGPAGLRIAPPGEGEKYTKFYSDIKFKENEFYSTAFPTGTAISSSFSKDLAYQIGRAIGKDCCQAKCGCLLAPALNIHRHPLGGRNYEYYSEDPRVAGEIAKHYVKGVQSTGTSACVKHFCCNNQETERMKIDVIISQRALREIYLENFRIAIEAKPFAAMTAYNKVNGKYCSQNKEVVMLLKEIGFDGLVMTDWFAGDSGVEVIKSGHNLIEPGTLKAYTEVDDALKSGDKELSLKIEESAIAIEKFCAKVNQHEPESLHIDPTEVARRAVSEGCVVLKNEKCLPIHNKVAVFGCCAFYPRVCGVGSGDVYYKSCTNIVDGLKQSGIDVTYSEEYFKHIEEQKKRPVKKFEIFELTEDYDERDVTETEVTQLSAASDSALIVIGRCTGEFRDRSKESFSLTPTEESLIQKVSSIYRAQSKKVLVVLNIGGVIETESWKDLVDGIVVCWVNGEQCGCGVADILTGRVNPSGRLPMTFVKDLKSVSGYSFPGTVEENGAQVIHLEDIYVGYRYYTTFNTKVSFPFGYGLSYTTFEYNNLHVEVNEQEKTVKGSVTVKNSGKVEGMEVVLLFISAPDGLLERPKRELRWFDKTKCLKSGEEQRMSFEMTFRDFAGYYEEDNTWICEKGKYLLSFNKDANTEIVNQEFEIKETAILEKTQVLCKPQVNFKRLSKTN